MSDYPSNGEGGASCLLEHDKPDGQLRLFAAERAPFPERQYQRLMGGGAPFQEFKGSLGGKKKAPEKEYWFPFHCPEDWNGVLIVAYHPSFPEMRRMEKHPGEFVGVLTGEAYTLLTAHILQKIGLSWSRCGHANLVPWYILPRRASPPGKNGTVFNSSND